MSTLHISQPLVVASLDFLMSSWLSTSCSGDRIPEMYLIYTSAYRNSKTGQWCAPQWMRWQSPLRTLWSGKSCTHVDHWRSWWVEMMAFLPPWNWSSYEGVLHSSSARGCLRSAVKPEGKANARNDEEAYCTSRKRRPEKCVEKYKEAVAGYVCRTAVSGKSPEELLYGV